MGRTHKYDPLTALLPSVVSNALKQHFISPLDAHPPNLLMALKK